MVAGANGNSIAIEHGADIMRVNAIEDERQHGSLLACSSDQAQAGNRAEYLLSVSQHLLFVGGYAIDSNLRNVIQRRTQSNGSGDMRRARLELVRQFVINGFLEGDGTDHVAASLIGRHSFG